MTASGPAASGPAASGPAASASRVESSHTHAQRDTVLALAQRDAIPVPAHAQSSPGASAGAHGEAHTAGAAAIPLNGAGFQVIELRTFLVD